MPGETGFKVTDGHRRLKKGILPPYRAAITPLKSSTLDIFHSISRILLYRQYSGLFPFRQGKPGHCPVNVRISGLWYTRTQSTLNRAGGQDEAAQEQLSREGSRPPVSPCGFHLSCKLIPGCFERCVSKVRGSGPC